MHLQWVSFDESQNNECSLDKLLTNHSLYVFSTKDLRTGKILDVSKEVKCLKAYPDYKISWARFPLYRDWLLSCPSCSDGIMLTDVRDVFFQSGKHSRFSASQMNYTSQCVVLIVVLFKILLLLQFNSNSRLRLCCLKSIPT